MQFLTERSGPVHAAARAEAPRIARRPYQVAVWEGWTTRIHKNSGRRGILAAGHSDRIVIKQDGATIAERRRCFRRGQVIYDPFCNPISRVKVKCSHLLPVRLELDDCRALTPQAGRVAIAAPAAIDKCAIRSCRLGARAASNCHPASARPSKCRS
jgi:hypothetical protein